MPNIAETRHRALARDALLVLDDARDLTLAVESGTVWLTLEKDPRDVVLFAGQRFRIDRPGRTVVMAHTPATLQLARAPRHAALRRIAAAFRDAFVRAFLAPRPRMLPYF